MSNPNNKRAEALRLRELARRRLTLAKRNSEPDVTIHHPLICELTNILSATNSTLRLRTIDTLNLVLRRMRLGLVVTRKTTTRKKTPD